MMRGFVAEKEDHVASSGPATGPGAHGETPSGHAVAKVDRTPHPGCSPRFRLLRNKRRMLAMVDRVTTHDIRWWTATFLDLVEAAAGTTVEAPAPAVHS